jgi:hypothetical protein
MEVGGTKSAYVLSYATLSKPALFLPFIIVPFQLRFYLFIYLFYFH